MTLTTPNARLALIDLDIGSLPSADGGFDLDDAAQLLGLFSSDATTSVTPPVAQTVSWTPPATPVRDLVDAARIRHWSFIEVELADGAAVLWVNQRQRHLLLKYRDALRGIVGASIETAAIVNGSLVGVNENGTPYYLTTTQDGYAVSLNDNGTPFVDTARAPLARDPFGQSGGTPGWPMPPDAIALLSMTASLSNGSESPVSIVDESERLRAAPGRHLPAFLGASRIVPIRLPSTFGRRDGWSSVISVSLSYIRGTTITSLDDRLVIPAPLHEPMIAGLAELFANQSRNCTTAERRQFTDGARRAELEIARSAFDILGDIETTGIIYQR